MLLALWVASSEIRAWPLGFQLDTLEPLGEPSVNVERLHAIAIALRDDLSRSNVQSHLQQLVSALHNQINQPGQPSYQQQVSQFCENLRSALESPAVNSFSPTWLQVLDEVGAAPMLGLALDEQVTEIFSRNQITPSVALQELQKIFTEIQALSSSIDQMLAAFRQLNIGSEELPVGDCEVGILVPRTFVDNRLDKFSAELSELNQIFGVFAEVATGGRPGFGIRAISSSDLSIFLDAAPVIGACVAVAIERIIALYKQLLEVRKLQGELAKQGVEKDNLKGIEKHANGIMEHGIDKLVKELLEDFHTVDDNARKNELSIELKYALKKIANRVDRGFNIEIRMTEPEATAPEADEQDEAAKEATRHHARIAAASKTLQFLKLQGEPILSLTEDKGERGNKAS